MNKELGIMNKELRIKTILIVLVCIIHYSLFIIQVNAQFRAPGETGISNFPASSPSRQAFLNTPNLTPVIPQLTCGPEGNGYRLCIPIFGVTYINNSLTEYVSLIYKFSLGIAGLLVFIMIVWGGIQLALSTGNTGLVGDAKNRIFQAVIGLILLLLSYIVLNTINPNLVQLREPGGQFLQKITIPNVEPLLENQTVENRFLQENEGAVQAAMKNLPSYLDSNNKQKQLLQGQINKELSQPNPDTNKVLGWQESLEQSRLIRGEVERRAAFKF